jgi:hypothetical protein
MFCNDVKRRITSCREYVGCWHCDLVLCMISKDCVMSFEEKSGLGDLNRYIDIFTILWPDGLELLRHRMSSHSDERFTLLVLVA